MMQASVHCSNGTCIPPLSQHAEVGYDLVGASVRRRYGPDAPVPDALVAEVPDIVRTTPAPAPTAAPTGAPTPHGAGTRTDAATTTGELR